MIDFLLILAIKIFVLILILFIISNVLAKRPC